MFVKDPIVFVKDPIVSDAYGKLGFKQYQKLVNSYKSFKWAESFNTVACNYIL